MRAVGTRLQGEHVTHSSEIEFTVQMRKQLAETRWLPPQRVAKRVGIDRNQEKPGLAGEMFCKRACDLGLRGEMDEAVAPVVGAATIAPLPFGFTPDRGGTNLVNRGCGHSTSSLSLKFIGFFRVRRILAATVSARRMYIKCVQSFVANCERWRFKVIIPSIRNHPVWPLGQAPSSGPYMLTHDQIWTALDRLAARAGLSPSALAKKAGLDPTTFNKSKRITSDGRERWPSTESVAKALAATNTAVDTFVQLIEDTVRTVQSVPLLGFAEAGTGGYFDDDGFPVGRGWDEVGLPSVKDEHAYALKISGDSMKPTYRNGDVIVVSPAAPIRKGDRVVVKTTSGEIMVKELRRRTQKVIELASINPNHRDRTLDAKDVDWIARILWARQ